MTTTAASTGRKFIDCSEFPSDSDCTLRISGKEDEVLPIAVHHATTVHGHEDTPEFREQLRSMLKDE
jgi:predicted small metal-binding protein